MLPVEKKTKRGENGVQLNLRSKGEATSTRLPIWEEALDHVKHGEDHLRIMIDQIPMPAWSCRPDGTTEFLNQRWLDYTGLSMEQALGWGWKVTIHPDDQGTLMDAWLRIFPSEEPGQAEARIRRFDGAYRWFLLCAVPVRNERDEVVRWYGTNSDIEELKRVEDQLRRDNRELRQIIDAIPQAVAVLAPDGSERSGNESVLEYSGFSLG